MKQIFVVTEVSFEYNDEYYYQGESEGGKPVNAYSTKEKAKAAIPELNKQWIAENSNSEWMSIAEYGGYEEPVLDLEAFAKKSGLELSEVEEAFNNYNTKAINKLVLDNLEEAATTLNINLFKITEVELED